jgi:hypothetical protein
VPGSIPNRHSTAVNICFFLIFNYCPSLQWRCGPYKAAFAHFHLVKRHVHLNWLVSCLNRSLFGQFLREICPFNRILVMVPLTAPFLGSFLRGHISLQNCTYCPLFRHNTTSFKYTCFLLSKKEAKIGLYGPHLYC